jgi:hypothetical protein
MVCSQTCFHRRTPLLSCTLDYDISPLGYCFVITIVFQYVFWTSCAFNHLTTLSPNETLTNWRSYEWNYNSTCNDICHFSWEHVFPIVFSMINYIFPSYLQLSNGKWLVLSRLLQSQHIMYNCDRNN